jgi:hypothetical protein
VRDDHRQHPERLRAACRRYRLRHRDRLRARQRADYRKHHQQKLADAAQYRATNHERVYAATRRWAFAHRPHLAAYQNARYKNSGIKRRGYQRGRTKAAYLREWRRTHVERARANDLTQRIKHLPADVQELRRTLHRFKRWMKANGYTLASLTAESVTHG